MQISQLQCATSHLFCLTASRSLARLVTPLMHLCRHAEAAALDRLRDESLSIADDATHTEAIL